MSAEPRAFVDTNILVYSYDSTVGAKHRLAAALVSDLWNSRRGCLSTQVLQEFYVTITRKLPQPLDVRRGRRALENFAAWLVHVPDARQVVAATAVQEQHCISFWDAMIVNSAAALGCTVLYTEDLNAGQVYDGVRVVDPFA